MLPSRNDHVLLSSLYSLMILLLHCSISHGGAWPSLAFFSLILILLLLKELTGMGESIGVKT